MPLQKVVCALLVSVAWVGASRLANAQPSFVDTGVDLRPNGSLTTITGQQDRSGVAGELVSQSAVTFGIEDGRGAFPSLGSISGSAAAQTDFGVNRVGVQSRFSYLVPATLLGQPNCNQDCFANYAAVGGTANSQWLDSWTVTGGAVGDSVSLSVQGRTTYNLGGTGLGAAAVVSPVQNIFHPGGSLLLNTSDFFASASQGFIDWSVSFAVLVDTAFSIGSFLEVNIDPFFSPTTIGSGSTSVFFDAMNTATLTSVQLAPGYALTSDSGQLRLMGDSYGYVSAVPEPGAALLMLAGLGVIGASLRRSKGGRPIEFAAT